MSKEIMWEMLESIGVAYETIDCMTSIHGYTEETLEDVLYYATGYRTFDQLMEA